MSLSHFIKEKALELGFDVVGIAQAGPVERSAAVQRWVSEGYHAHMDWFARTLAVRLDSRKLFPGATSLVLVGVRYFVADPPPESWNDPSRGRVARFAWGTDYHDAMRGPLEKLARFIEQQARRPLHWRAFVDASPIHERDAAERAGLGTPGRHTLLINRKLGSYLLLGGLALDLQLACDFPVPAAEAQSLCSSCRRCLEACPTQALRADYVLDARRCISYLTIENKGPIPEPLRSRIGNWIFGCDACQEACPHARPSSHVGPPRLLKIDADIATAPLLALLRLDETEFRRRYAATPVARLGRAAFLRNVCVALGNWADRHAANALEKAASDPHPLIREHAQWALQRVLTVS